MSGFSSNGLLHSRIIERLRCSHDPLSVVKSLNQNGTQMKDLNHYPEIGTLLCDIVRRNYGLGIKILFDCGLDLSSEEQSTGDTPLLLVCSEGLCGSTKQLIHCLPRAALFHANQTGATALKHLLTRAHANCGCLETLLARFRPCKQLFPVNYDRRCVNWVPATDELDQTNPTIVLDGNAIFLTVETLLARVRSTDPRRIFGVFQLWIRHNLLLIEPPTPETVQHQHRNIQSLYHRLVEPVMKRIDSTTTTPEDDAMGDQLVELIIQLIILGQLHSKSAWTELKKFLSSSFDTEPFKLELSKAAQQLGSPIPLQAITIHRLRQLLQQRFAQLCHNPNRPECETIDALVFPNWVRSLPIPGFMQTFVLLDSTYFHFHH